MMVKDDLPGTTYRIKWKGKVITLTLGEDRLWRDQNGTIYGLLDSHSTLDEKIRCGIGPFSLPDGHPLNRACRAHDAMYSIPVWQKYHTRAEADADLARQLKEKASGYSKLLVKPFYLIARVLGRFFWENKSTNN